MTKIHVIFGKLHKVYFRLIGKIVTNYLAVVCGRDGFVDEAVQEELKPQHSVVRVEHRLGPALRLQTPDQNYSFIYIFYTAEDV